MVDRGELHPNGTVGAQHASLRGRAFRPSRDPSLPMDAFRRDRYATPCPGARVLLLGRRSARAAAVDTFINATRLLVGRHAFSSRLDVCSSGRHVISSGLHGGCLFQRVPAGGAASPTRLARGSSMLYGRRASSRPRRMLGAYLRPEGSRRLAAHRRKERARESHSEAHSTPLPRPDFVPSTATSPVLASKRKCPVKATAHRH